MESTDRQGAHDVAAFFEALAGGILQIPMVCYAVTLGVVWIVEPVPLRIAVAIGVWMVAIVLRTGRGLGPRRAQFAGFACLAIAPVIVFLERYTLDATIAAEWQYVHGQDSADRLVFDAILGPFVVAPLVALLVGMLAFVIVSPRARTRLDRASRLAPWILAVLVAASTVLAALRARTHRGPFARKIAAADLEHGVVPAEWTPLAAERWEIVGAQSTLVIARRAGRYDFAVRRLDGGLVSLATGLGPRIEIARDDPSDAWLVEEPTDFPAQRRPYMALGGSIRTKLTVADLARSTAAPRRALVMSTAGLTLATVLLAIARLRRRRAESVRWQAAQIETGGHVVLADGTKPFVSEHVAVTALSPGTSVLVLLEPPTETSAYRHQAIVTRLVEGTPEEWERARLRVENALGTWALGILSLSSATLSAAITLGIGVGW